MKVKLVKKILSGLLAASVIFSGVVFTSEEVKADNTAVVQYQKVSVTDFESNIKEHRAPKCDVTQFKDGAKEEASGYLFGGWFTYTDENTVGSAIRDASDVGGASYVYAKFVPARLTGVSCQVGVDAESKGSTSLRVVSTVDSTDYKAVGFNVYGREKDNSGTYDWTMYEYNTNSTAQSTKVYSGLQTYKFDTDETTIIKDDVKKPQDIFGTDATGFKFTTMSLSGITGGEDGYYGLTIVVRPYWITMDGTYVEGTAEFNRVNDSPNITSEPNIVNVSVNLKDVSDIAAGKVNISYPEQFTFVEAECGRVFGEMEFNPDTTNRVVKCVGNITELENVEKPEDVYVNLRFEVNSSVTAGQLKFVATIPENGFCDIDENVKDIKVSAWDVVY